MRTAIRRYPLHRGPIHSRPLVKVLSETGEMLGRNAESLRRVLPYLRNDLVVEIGDDFPNLLFNTRHALGKVLVDLASKLLKSRLSRCRILNHDSLATQPHGAPT